MRIAACLRTSWRENELSFFYDEWPVDLAYKRRCFSFETQFCRKNGILIAHSHGGRPIVVVAIKRAAKSSGGEQDDQKEISEGPFFHKGR
jgi:hypothetical protein